LAIGLTIAGGTAVVMTVQPQQAWAEDCTPEQLMASVRDDIYSDDPRENGRRIDARVKRGMQHKEMWARISQLRKIPFHDAQ
jgi:hypothetical protein